MDIENHSFYQAFYRTPPLWEGEYEGMVQFVFPQVDLTSFILLPIPQNQRLGNQLEFIFHQLILHSNTYEVLAYNLPIRKNKISLGEIDFILQHTFNKTLIHLELTYKFYIIIDDGIAKIEDKLIGPNYRDTFILKRDKLKVHQLLLPRSLEGTASLYENGIDPLRLTPQVCFKAQLFTPFSKPNLNLSPFNPECVAGNWISSMEFYSEEFKSYQYYIPSKMEWLLLPHNNVVWSSYTSVFDGISKQLANKSTPLVWLKAGSDELQKMFIIWGSP